jgi:ADP-ribose pyrophosphatase YjhB (NUDIX family)
MKRYGGILVVVNNECLLCKRNSSGNRPGEWSVPAGKIESNESLEDGVRREFFEETNLELNGDIKKVAIILRKNRTGLKSKGLFYVFLSRQNKKLIPDLENAIDGDEHTECGYFSKDNLPDNVSLGLRRLISRLLE